MGVVSLRYVKQRDKIVFCRIKETIKCFSMNLVFHKISGYGGGGGVKRIISLKFNAQPPDDGDLLKSDSIPFLILNFRSRNLELLAKFYLYFTCFNFLSQYYFSIILK